MKIIAEKLELEYHYFWTRGKMYVFLDIWKDICTLSWTYGKTLFWTYGKTHFLILKNMFLLEKNICDTF